MTADLQKRTIAKTLTWLVTASLTTFIIAWVLTGDLLIGVSIGSIETQLMVAMEMQILTAMV